MDSVSIIEQQYLFLNRISGICRKVSSLTVLSIVLQVIRFLFSKLVCMANLIFSIDLEGASFGNPTGCCEILQNNLTYSIGYNIESDSFFSAIFGNQGQFDMLNKLKGSLQEKNIQFVAKCYAKMLKDARKTRTVKELLKVLIVKFELTELETVSNNS